MTGCFPKQPWMLSGSVLPSLALFLVLILSGAVCSLADHGRKLEGILAPVSPVYSAISWDPDTQYTKLSSAIKISDITPAIDGSQITVPYCNHYAINKASMIYSPCSAQYLVAAMNYGAILPPNMCGGEVCPSAGGAINSSMMSRSYPHSCGDLLDFVSGAAPTGIASTLFDQYCVGTQSCSPVAGARPPNFSPPIFSISTNWCSTSASNNMPSGALVTVSSNGFAFSNLKAPITCPGDTGYSNTPGPSTNDVVMQICLTGCQKVEKPITFTLNIMDPVLRKGNGAVYWKLGIWDAVNSIWYVVCDGTRTAIQRDNNQDILEVSVPSPIINQYMDQTGCIIVAPVTNYQGCPGLPFTAMTNTQAAAMASMSVFGLMLILQILVCVCCQPKPKLLVQPSQQQIIYVEAPHAVPRMVEKVVERVVPQPVMMHVVQERIIDERYQTLPSQGYTTIQAPMPMSAVPQGYTTMQAPVRRVSLVQAPGRRVSLPYQA